MQPNRLFKQEELTTMMQELSNPYPVMSGDYPDPSIVRVGNDYYMVHTSSYYAPGLLIWHSTDLSHWEPLTYVIDEYSGDIWAPELVFIDGTFYLYFPANGTNYVTTSAKPEGPWTTPIDLKVSGIDPGHLLCPDGRRYLYLSRGYMTELAADGLSVLGEPQKVYEGWPIPEDWVVEGFTLESPKLLYKDGYYHLISAQGGTSGPATSHMVVSSRSRSPFGPWEHSPYNPVIHTYSRAERWWSQGHGTLIDTAAGEWWIVYHAYERDYHTLGRPTLIQPVEWTEDGWFRIAEPSSATERLEQLREAGASNAISLSDRFDSSRLGWQWRFYKEHDKSRYTVGDGKLVLQCKSSSSSPADSGPLMCIPYDHAYEAEVEVEVTPGAEAGLILYYNEKCYCGIAFTEQSIHRYRRAEKGMAMSNSCNKLHLRLINDHHEIKLYYRQDGQSWIKFPQAMEVSGYHHNTIGDFLSLRLGVFAAGQGEAVFRNFKYKALE
jgi:xylan 1,4-beta-xylosidase